jgi:hypothetical protein
LALVFETMDDEIGILACAHQLDGNLLQVFVVRAEGPVDLSHPAKADLLHNLVGANSLAQ